MDIFDVEYVFGATPDGPFLLTERVEAMDFDAAVVLAERRLERSSFSFQDGTSKRVVVNSANVLYCNVRPAPQNDR